jgi:hypothetical protein
MKEEELGYRGISKKLNQWGIKSHRGCEWFNTSVSSGLKRKHERDELYFQFPVYFSSSIIKNR